ncbi:MAG TPA: DUF2914 domain-containing protein [Nitrospirae bacterium]|nr:hypothetical protein BMS3Abin06_02169 [bacterium BMS3Abin06]HDH10801.1 DUF2914 domain-containing protein [Nitrospirota bacterium]HDZ00955.1 DUF2914 domain-containing protein [Nitrospirota bacterium]
MKKILLFIVALSISLVPVSLTFAESGDQEASPVFKIERLVIAGSIDNREPVGVVNVFASSTEKVYCFLEAGNIEENTTVSFVWYYGEKEVARIELPLKQGSRWRTYSSKKLGGRTGDWKVELQDAGGAVLETVEFRVE